MHDAKSFFETWPKVMDEMKSEAPAIGKGFGLMYKDLMGEGALIVREKELIALGIAMAIRCEQCVYAHVDKAVSLGITREEFTDLAGVVVAMQGGPGYVHVPMLLEAIKAKGL